MIRLTTFAGVAIAIGICLITTSTAAGVAPIPTSEQNKLVRDVVTLRGRGKIVPVHDISSFARAEPRDAVVGFWIVMREFQRRTPEIVELAGLYLAQNEEAGTYIDHKLKALPHLIENSSRRLYYFEMLPHIPASWSARIAAKYLLSEDPLISEYEGDAFIEFATQFPVVVNQNKAAWVLGNMGFSNAPTPPDQINYTSSTIALWREWWRENEHRIDELVAEIVEERERELAGMAPQTTPPGAPASSPDIAVKPHSQEITPVPHAADAADAADAEIDSITWLSVIGAVVLVCIAAILIVLVQRRGRRHHAE